MSLLLRPIRTLPGSNAISASSAIRSRTFSTTRTQRSDANAVAEAFLSKFASGQTFVRKQYIDANQLRLFSLMLDRAQVWPSSQAFSHELEKREPVEGTPLPAGYHLAYFTPAQLPGVLGIDGSDASFNPEAPFTRRMWAGGSLEWTGADPSQHYKHLLRVGDTVSEITKLLSCEPKTIKKTGESMLVVGLEKEFRDGKDNLCLVDRRNWVFRAALDPSKPAKPPKKAAELSGSQLDEQSQGKIVRKFNRDEVTLFRMSALTFNAHRIHYDKPWATEVEGHRNVVVHGPLNLIAMLDLWRDAAVERGAGGERDEIVYPQKIDYRATSPVYAGEPYRALLNEDFLTTKQGNLSVTSDDGTECMKGTVTAW